MASLRRSLSFLNFFVNSAGRRLAIRKTSIPTSANKHYLTNSAAFRALSHRFLPVLGSLNSTSLQEGCVKFSLTNSEINRRFSPPRNRDGPGDDRRDDDDHEEVDVFMLMDIPIRIWPNPVKTAKNAIMATLIRSTVPEFDSKEFMRGALQAMVHVSKLISRGNFDDLDGMVASDAVEEIRDNWENCSQEEKEKIEVYEEDILYKFIYEIGLIFDDNSGRRYAEITTVFHGNPCTKDMVPSNPDELMKDFKTGRAEYIEKAYCCNYRFIREITKGVDDDWTINQLNHFSPHQIATTTGPFSR